MKVTALSHANHDTTGTLGQFLRDAGWDFRAVNACYEDLSDFDAQAPDLLIVMGGTPGVYQKDDYPFLKHELKILEKRMEKDLPVIGICLGAQLMAGALGAKVFRGAQGPEIGWREVKINEAGMKTPLSHLDAAHTQIFQWHSDTFDLPHGAIRLAGNAQYENQAFSVGNNAIALQFHAEVTDPMLAAWYASAAGEVASGAFDLKQMRAQTKNHVGTLTAQSRKFLGEWIGARCGAVGEKRRA